MGNTKSKLLDRFLTAERVERIDTVLAGRTNNITVVLDRIKNAHNVSAVLRSADAFGVGSAHLVGEQFEFTKGVTLGSERWINLTHHKTPTEAVKHLKDDGFELVALQPVSKTEDGPKSVPVYDLPFDKKLALVFGHEVYGVQDEFIDQVDRFAYIPMLGFVESLNISVAAAICLYTARLPQLSDKKSPAVLNEAESEAQRLHWLKRDIKAAEAILKEHEQA